MTEWNTIFEEASRLKMSVSRLRKNAAAGRIPGHKQGNRWLFDPDEVDQSIRSYNPDPLKQSARSRGRKRSIA